jgi:F420-dependent oxidoreductase-like protein
MLKLGIQLNQFDTPAGDAAIGPEFAAIARAVDEGGFASLWMMDHFFQIPPIGDAERPMLEAYSALAFAAAITSQVQLGTLVTGTTYRHPGLLAKTVTTLDVLSGGRAWLGIGAGWFEREHVGLGVPFPSTAERFERLEETLQIVQQMWSPENGPYTGKHYQLAETLNMPQALSQPHPPIMIGGGGERKTLRLVAQYADACNLFDSPELPHKLDVLRDHCTTLGRDYATIEKTVHAGNLVLGNGADGTQTVDQVASHLQDLAALGIDHVIYGQPAVQGQLMVEGIGTIATELLPATRQITVAGR